MWAVRADCVVMRRFDECDSQRRLCDPTEPLLLRGGGVCRPPGRTSESRCSSNTAQTPTMLCRGHMLMILARLVRSESFWAVVKVRSPHTGPEVCYIITPKLWLLHSPGSPFMPPRGRPTLVVLSPVASSSVASSSVASLSPASCGMCVSLLDGVGFFSRAR